MKLRGIAIISLWQLSLLVVLLEDEKQTAVYAAFVIKWMTLSWQMENDIGERQYKNWKPVSTVWIVCLQVLRTKELHYKSTLLGIIMTFSLFAAFFSANSRTKYSCWFFCTDSKRFNLFFNSSCKILERKWKKYFKQDEAINI